MANTIIDKLKTLSNEVKGGAAAGAAIGFVGAGPIGALLGGVAGAVAGQMIEKKHPAEDTGASPAYMMQKHQEAVNSGYYPPEMVVSIAPDGTQAHPYLMAPGQIYGQKGAWGTRMANGIQLLGQFSQPVTLFGKTQWKWVQVSPPLNSPQPAKL